MCTWRGVIPGVQGAMNRAPTQKTYPCQPYGPPAVQGDMVGLTPRPPLHQVARGSRLGLPQASGEQVAQRRLRRGEAEGEAEVEQALRHLALTVEEQRG